MTTTLDSMREPSGSLLPFLDREHTVARPGYSRWMAPPAALCVHLCIGQAYAFSVFNLPMTRLLGVSQSAPADWKLTDLGWIFSLAMVFLGLSAAVFGRWVEEGGPRKAMFTAGVCWASAFLISALGVYLHNLWIIYLGYGVIGGCALGIGYISPVSTLMKWFPDRPGMATGMAIMGFGGGALIASPLSVWLMSLFFVDIRCRRAQSIHHPRLRVLRVHDGRLADRARAGAWMEAGRLRPACQRHQADDEE
jgi:MFS family permease